MELELAIEKILNGDTIMFAGAGCSLGAMNLLDQPIPIGNELTQYFKEKVGIKGNSEGQKRLFPILI